MFGCGRGVKISQNAVRNHTAGHYIKITCALHFAARTTIFILIRFYTYQTLKLTEVSP